MTALTGYLKARGHMSYSTPEAVFFHISPSRASQVLIDILGEDFGGIVVCNYYSANKKFINDNRILVQFCWAHLVRDIKFLTTLSYKAARRWAEALLGILRKLFALWKTRRLRHSGRYQRMIEKWRKRFLQKVRKPPNHNEAWNIKDRFKGSGEKGYFLFLKREGLF
jgi:transposase